MGWRGTISGIHRNIILQIALLTGFFWCYHWITAYMMTTLKIRLGAIGSQTVPLYAQARMNLDLWVIPALIILSLYILLFRVFFEKRETPWYILISLSIILAVSINTTVAMIDGGLKALLEPYTRTGLEYYADVPKVKGVWEFLRDYVRILGTLSGHSQTHPPGGVLFLWLVSKLFGRGLVQASFSTIVFTSFTVIPVYLLTKELYDETIARRALGLFLITPSMVMFTATAMDGPFSLFPILSVYLFYKALSRGSILFSVLTGIALGFGMLMNYTTVVIGLFFIITGVITFLTERERFKTVLKVCLIAGGTFTLFYLLLYLWARYNLLSALWASYKKDERSMGTGYESFGRYFNISIANLFAFLIGVGIPSTMIWLHEISSELRQMIRFRSADIYVLSSFLTLILISFSTLFTLEVERIWIFMVPFIVIPVAKHLYEGHHRWEFYVVALLLCVQLLLSEIFLYTYW